MLPRALIGLIALAVPMAATAQTQVPGTPYVRFTSPQPFQYLTGAMPIAFPTGTDEGEITVTLPFEFKYYDTQVTQITIATNGGIVMSPGGDMPWTPISPPGPGGPQGYLAPLYADYNVISPGVVSTKVEGVEPERVYVVEWANVPGWAQPSWSVSSQVRLHEGPSGRIQIDFGNAVGSWVGAMGMEDLNGNRAILFASSGCTNQCGTADFSALTNQRLELTQDPGVELIASSVRGPQFGFLGAQATITIGLGNLHGAVIGPFTVQVVASTSPDMTNALEVYSGVMTLNAFQFVNQQVTGVFPASLGEGLVYLGINVDSTGAIAEVNETNNSAVGDVPTRLILGAPDLEIERVSSTMIAANAGDVVPVTVRVTNVGGEPAVDASIDVVLTTNLVVSPQDASLGRYQVTLGPSETDERTFDVTIPSNANSGVYYLAALADPLNAIDELSESNNGLAAPTTIEITGGAIGIVTTQLPIAYVRIAYTGLLNAVGGGTTRTWSIINGTLPDGLGMVAATGEIYGRPLREQSSTFTVMVESNGNSDTQELRLDVVDPEQPLTIVTRDVPTAIVGQEYAFMLVATGGTTGSTLTWTAENLPDGLSVGTNSGLLGGTPIAPRSATALITVTDGTATATREVVINVQEYTNLLIVPAVLPMATYGQPYEFQLTASGGVAPITWLVDVGRLPIGLELSTSGLISGTPMEISDEPFRVVVEARDSGPPGAQAHDVNTFELVVSDVAGFMITTSALPEGQLNAPYDQRISATGGTEPYVWRYEGTLPRGIDASTNPVTNEFLLVGAPEETGLFTLTLTVTDRDGRIAARALAIRVTEAQVIMMNDANKDDGGCGCTTAQETRSSGGAAVFALLIAGAFIYRRRR